MKNILKKIWHKVTDWRYIWWDWGIFFTIIVAFFIILIITALFVYAIGPTLLPILESLPKPVTQSITIVAVAAYILYLVMALWSWRRRQRRITLDISVADIIQWSQNLEISMEQIKKTYDWQISQWSIFGKALLTASLTFVSGSVIAKLKGDLKFEGTSDFLYICFGVIVTLSAYGFSSYHIRQLRKEYLSVYKIINFLS